MTLFQSAYQKSDLNNTLNQNSKCSLKLNQLNLHVLKKVLKITLSISMEENTIHFLVQPMDARVKPRTASLRLYISFDNGLFTINNAVKNISIAFTRHLPYYRCKILQNICKQPILWC